MKLLRAAAAPAAAAAMAGCLLAAGCGNTATPVGTGSVPPTTAVSRGTSLSPTVSSPVLGPAATVTRAPITRSPIHGVIQLTSGDANATFLVKVGQSLQLTLSDPGSQWGRVTAAPPGLLVAAQSPAPPRQGQLAVWAAAKAGTARVTAVATAYCPAGYACAMWARLFEVTIVIS